MACKGSFSRGNFLQLQDGIGDLANLQLELVLSSAAFSIRKEATYIADGVFLQLPKLVFRRGSHRAHFLVMVSELLAMTNSKDLALYCCNVKRRVESKPNTESSLDPPGRRR
jgi:hypothetical protein